MSQPGRRSHRIATFATCLVTLTASQACFAGLLEGMWPFSNDEEKHIQAWESNPTQELRWGEWEKLRLAPSGTSTPNQHPVQISPEQVAKTLMGIQVKPFREVYPLFSEDELKRFATPIAIALSKADPGQDVEFLSMGQHSVIGVVAPSLGTSGRIFYADGRLNLILGMAHKDFVSDYMRGSRRKPVFNFGSRKTQASDVKITGVDRGDGKVLRDDWISLAVAAAGPASTPTPRPATTPVATPAASTTPAPAAQAPASSAAPDPADALAQKSAARLKALQRLKNEGLLTDEEYRQKRAEILKDL